MFYLMLFINDFSKKDKISYFVFGVNDTPSSLKSLPVLSSSEFHPKQPFGRD